MGSRVATLSLSTGPTAEPVTVDEVIRNARALDDAETRMLLKTRILPAARRYVERETHRALINQTWVQYHDAFPDVFYLEWSPVSSVTSIQYIDTAGSTQTLSSSNYQTDLVSKPARICEARNVTWPSTDDQSMNAVIVTYVAGFGAAAASVPIGYRHAIEILAGHWYWNPDAFACQAIDGNMEKAMHAMLANEGMTSQYA